MILFRPDAILASSISKFWKWVKLWIERDDLSRPLNRPSPLRSSVTKPPKENQNKDLLGFWILSSNMKMLKVWWICQIEDPRSEVLLDNHVILWVWPSCWKERNHRRTSCGQTYGKTRQKQRAEWKNKCAVEKNKAGQRQKIAQYLLHWSSGWGVQRNYSKRADKVGNSDANSNALQDKVKNVQRNLSQSWHSPRQNMHASLKPTNLREAFERSWRPYCKRKE